MRRLILAEKFSAALRLARVLSQGTTKKVRADGASYFTFSADSEETIVFPLRGHVVEIDYPSAYANWRSADLDRLIDVEPEARESPPSLHDALRALAPTLDEIVLATDYDREGELIGVEALETLRRVRPDVRVRRARFSAMTPSEIRGAFQNLAEPDWALAAAASARRRLDLAWGAVLTRFLTTRCSSGREILSVGRVQTPALALVADREREKEGFVARPFWNVELRIADPPLLATAVGGPFWDRGGAEATAALAGLDTTAVVDAAENREDREPPPSPLNTTLLLAEASRAGISTPRAMALAQDLYVRGEISYPRTDNTVYPPSLDLRALVERLLDSPYRSQAERILASPAVRPSRGPIEASDHPPIHPTAPPARPGRKGPRAVIQDLVIRRFLATLSPPAVVRTTVLRLRLGDAVFQTRGRTLLEPGWRAVLPTRERFEAPPDLAPGVALPVAEVRVVEARTRPPPPHTQGSLLQAMEREGLGTKSTRHEILGLLFTRRYVEGRSLRTTPPGRALVDALRVHVPVLTSPDMTRRLEERMTAVAGGWTTEDEVVRESRTALHGVLADLRSNEASLARWLRSAAFLARDYGPCDACATGRLVRRRTRTGWAFLGCSEYPRCRRRLRLGPAGERLPWQVSREPTLATP